MKHASHINLHVLVEEVDELDVVDDVELDASVRKKIFIVTGSRKLLLHHTCATTGRCTVGR